MPPVVAEAGDLLEGAAHDAAIPPADRVVELVGEDRNAPPGARARLDQRGLRLRTERRGLLQRADAGRELLLARACCFELGVERALAALGGVERLGEPGHFRRGPGLHTGPERVAIAGE